MDNPEGTQSSDRLITASVEKTQKEQQWQQRVNELGHITDALRKPIDLGIFETVVALNLFDIHTTQSCEGHLDRGIAAPWVEVQAPETETGKALRKQANQLADTIETLEHEERPDEELAPLYQALHRLHREIRRPQLEEIQNAMRVLAEFYQARQVPYERLLTIHGNRIESQGAIFQEIISPEERDQKLLDYQQEMQAFTAFLKNKYLSS